MNKSSPSPLSGIFHSIIIPIPTSLTLTLEWRNFIVNIFEANFCLTGGGGHSTFFGQFGAWSVGTSWVTFRITQAWVRSGLHRDGYFPDYTGMATCRITQGWLPSGLHRVGTFRITQGWLPSGIHKVGYLPNYTGLATFRITQDMREHGHQFPAGFLNTNFARFPPSLSPRLSSLAVPQDTQPCSFSPEQRVQWK